MSRYLDGISVRIKESVDAATITKVLDHKAFEKIRNYGQALVHDDANVVVEFFDRLNKGYHPNSNCLKSYHHPDHVYSLKTRKVMYTLTYDVARAVSRSHPLEPFLNLDNELIYSKPYKIWCKEEGVLAKILPLGSSQKTLVFEPDGIILNDTHGGILSSMVEYDHQKVLEFHQTCMGFYYFQKLTADQGKAYDLWRTIFSKQVMLYLGFRVPLTAQQISHCRSMHIRPLSWENGRMELL